MAEQFDWGGLIGGALGAAAPLYAATQNQNAADKALQAQQNAATQIGAVQQPYANLGEYAAGLLANNDPTVLPGYQNGLLEGERSINRAAASRGQFNSGNTLKALTKYGIDYNQQQTERRQNQLMQLLSAGQGSANAMSNVLGGVGNAQGAATISKNNSANNGLIGALGSVGSYLTSKGSNGNSNFSNIADGVSGLWNSYFGGGSQAPSPTYSNDSYSSDSWGLGDGGFWGS